MQAMFRKLPGGYLEPVGEDAELFVASLKLGAGVKFEVTKVRNIGFHRKAMKLLRVGFEMWVPDGVAIDGIIPAKDFDSFRERILILAGHCDATYEVDGGISFKARSISFASCSELEFRKVYQAILDVVWERIMKQANYRTAEELDGVVNKLLAFT